MIILGAKRREIEISISIQQADALFQSQNKKCAISGVEIGFGAECGENVHSRTASLDRIDSRLGYIQGNVQWVHKQVNFMKNDLSMESFDQWIMTIAAHRAIGMPQPRKTL